MKKLAFLACIFLSACVTSPPKCYEIVKVGMCTEAGRRGYGLCIAHLSNGEVVRAGAPLAPGMTVCYIEGRSLIRSQGWYVK